MINLSISVPIYVTVEGTENISFEIDSVNLFKNTKDNNIFYKMVIKNDGNVHIRHSGKIQIFDAKKKKEINTVTIEETVPTYCEKTRDFTGNIPALDNGKYVAVFYNKCFRKRSNKRS
jgi:hypothetical protein